PRGGREVGREGDAGDVGVPGPVHGDGQALVGTAAPEVGAVKQHRVDDQGPGVVVIPHREPHPAIVPQYLLAGDRVLDAAVHLVVLWHVRVPERGVVAQQVVAAAGQVVRGYYLRVGGGPVEVEAEHVAGVPLPRAGGREHGRVVGQEQAQARAAAQEANPAVA